MWLLFDQLSCRSILRSLITFISFHFDQNFDDEYEILIIQIIIRCKILSPTLLYLVCEACRLCIVLYWISDGGAIWCAFWDHVPLLTLIASWHLVSGPFRCLHSFSVWPIYISSYFAPFLREWLNFYHGFVGCILHSIFKETVMAEESQSFLANTDSD